MTGKLPQTREEFIAFVRQLRCDHEAGEDYWQHDTVEAYLGAMEARTEDSMPRIYANEGRDPLPAIVWETLADILYAAAVYE